MLRLFLASIILVLALAVSGSPGIVQAQQAGVDLAVFTGRHQPGGNPVGNYLVVANHGGETAYGVRVEIEVNAGRHIVADLVDTSQRISDYRSLIELSNPSHGVVEFNVGGDPHRAVWNVAQLAGRSQHTVDLGFTTQENEYMELSFEVGNEAPEEPSSTLGDNAIEFLLLRPKNRSSIILFEAGSYSIQATVSPQTGGEVVFNITASLIPHVVSAIAQTHLLDALVETRLTGLEYVSHEVREGDARGMISEGDDDLYSHNSGANTGALAIGNWARGRPYTFHLELTTSPVDGAEEREQCLTAEISGFPEAPGVNGVDASTDNTARVCVEPQQPETPVPTILSDGEVSLFTWYDCVGQTDYPCAGTSAANNDQLQLVVVQGEANADTPPEEVLQPGDVIVHVPDPSGRYIIPPDNDDGEIFWSTGFADLSRSGVQLADSFPASASWDDNDDNTDGDPDGEVSIEYTVPSNGGIASYWGTNRGRAGDVLWGFNASNPYENDDYALYFGPLFLEFNRLGTYQMRFTIGANHDTDDVKHSDTETYTFHVGPIADLAVHETWQTAEGLSVAVVNNGPDRSPGARVVLDDTGESCLLGSMAPLEGRTCTIAGASLTGAGTVENHVPYEVCIDPNFVFDPHADNDSTIDAASEAECEGAPNNGSWHSVAVYDHDPSNSVITGLSDAAPVPEGVGAQTRQTRMLIDWHTVSWEPVEQLYGLDVAHYQVERLGLTSNRWKLIAAVRETSYDDTDEDLGSSPRYRVRAVNVQGQFGPWAETGAGGLPRLTLALDPATIKEPDPDDSGAVTEATVTARLNKASGQDVDITVSAELASGSDTEGQPSFTLSDNKQLMIPAGMLESTGIVTISANADDDGLNEQVRVSAVAAYVQANIPAVTLTIQDDDAPGLVLSDLMPPAVPEGGESTYTVALNAQPSGNVHVRLYRGNNDITVDTDTGAGGVQDTLVFTPDDGNWNRPRTVTVGGVEDEDAADEMTTIRHSILDSPSAREYRSVPDVTLKVTVTDNDTGQIGVKVEPLTLNVTEGQSGKPYKVSLGTRPSGNVYITTAIVPAEPGESGVRVSPATIVLNSNNWGPGRTVTVSAVRDQDGDDEMGTTIAHAIDTERTTATEYLTWYERPENDVDSVTVNVSDVDKPGVQVSPETLRINEGRSGTYSVKLNTQPTADVTVAVSSSNDDLTMEPASLTFTPDNWSQPQWVTVTARDDNDAADDTATLRHSVSSGDGAYNTGQTDVTVTVTVTDPDRPGVTIGPLSPTPVKEANRWIEETEIVDEEERSAGRMRMTEAHPSFYTVRLDTNPTGNVVIDLDTPHQDKVTVYPTSLTFTPDRLSWTVTVHARDDADKDDEKATITHKVNAAESADEYDTVTVRSLDVSVDDNDDPGVTLLVSGPLELPEGGTAEYQMVLDTQADGVIVIGVESSKPGKVSVEPEFLWFSGIQLDHGRTWPDWDEPQTITVTALDDADAADETVTLIHRIADANAHGWDVPIGAKVGEVIVTVRDDD